MKFLKERGLRTYVERIQSPHVINKLGRKWDEIVFLVDVGLSVGQRVRVGDSILFLIHFVTEGIYLREWRIS